MSNVGIPERSDQGTTTVYVYVMPDGPLIVNVYCTLEHLDGRSEARGPATAFCRFERSANKPFCDGSHLIGPAEDRSTDTAQ